MYCAKCHKKRCDCLETSDIVMIAGVLVMVVGVWWFFSHGPGSVKVEEPVRVEQVKQKTT